MRAFCHSTSILSLALYLVAQPKFPDSLFQLGAFADLWELFACPGELISLFGRTGNFAASH
jgi:hypothetical protein